MAVERGSGTLSPAEAESLLQWWEDAGVDCLIDEAPRDWLRPKPAAAAAAPVMPVPALAEPALPGQLDLFHALLAESGELPFVAPGAPRVCPAGDPSSSLMMLSDMPTTEDCTAGILLSGETGRLFDRMLAAMGLDRARIYLASLSCLRAPSGAFNAESSSRCATLARHHVGLVAPKALILLGDTCAKAMLGMSTIQARGRWHDVATHSGPVPALATFHPAYLLDQPSAKRHAWADLQMAMERLGS